jgi:hypothetical protein
MARVTFTTVALLAAAALPAAGAETAHAHADSVKHAAPAPAVKVLARRVATPPAAQQASATKQASTTKPAATTAAKPATAAAVKPATSAPHATPTTAQATAAAKPAAPARAKAAAVTAKAVSMQPTVTPVEPATKSTNVVTPGPSAAKPMPGPDVTPIADKVIYQYNALGRRDPFQALVGGGFVGAEEEAAPPDVGGIKVVGIVWGPDDKFALVEDPRGNSHVLRTGDRVMNGVVDGLRRDAMIVKITTENGTDVVTIPLTRKGDDTNANR